MNLKNKFFNKDDFLYIENTNYQVASNGNPFVNFYADDKSFVSIEKVNVGSASDGSSSNNDSSSESGGIGDLPEIIAQSNFDSKIPDEILLNANNVLKPRAYTFWGFDNSLTPPIIVYRLKGDGFIFANCI